MSREPLRAQLETETLTETSFRVEQLPSDLLQAHIDAFFQFVYPSQANAIIHRGTLFGDVKAGRASRKLLLSICAISSRFLERTDGVRAPLQGSAQAQAWAREAKTLLVLDDMSTEAVATALILAKYEINSGRYSHAFVLASVASRMAMGLRLHKETSPDHPAGPTERETRRRLMWGCYCLDRMMSTGVPELLLTQASTLQVKLPCDDYHFLLGIPCDMPFPSLETESDVDLAGQRDYLGVFALYVELMSIRTMILK